MGADYNYYNIDIADIWQYERLLFLSGKSSEKFIRDIFPRIEDLIIIKGVPTFKTEDYGKGDNEFDQIFAIHIEDFNETSGDFKSRYSLNYFFTNDFCFHYNNPIILDSNHENFDFWFILKLRQYDLKLSEIKNFLDFHLEINFKNGINKFIDFLKIGIRQHKDQLLVKRVIETVNDWIENKLKLNEENDLDDKLILNINYDQSELFEILKPYFNEGDLNKLNQLLSGDEIQGKIYFGSNSNQLVMIFRQLHIHQKIIGTKKNTSKWICQYFTYLNYKEIMNFDVENVYKILTSSYYDIRDSERINIPGLEYIIDKSN